MQIKPGGPIQTAKQVYCNSIHRCFFLTILTLGSGYGQLLPGDTLQLIYVGGQSNALNLHADAALLPDSESDSSILFYYHTGLSPDHPSFPEPFFATSDSHWTTLQIQNQDPYIGFFNPYFGPEMTLARTLSENGIENLGILKVAYAGTHLAHDWKKGDHSMADIYDLLLDQFEIAMDSLSAMGLNWRFIGMIWMQGESDASDAQWAADYENNLTEFIANLRADFQTPDLPVALGRIADTEPYPYDLEVRAAQEAVAEADPRIHLIDLDDLPMEADRVHFIGPGIMEMGSRMANSLLLLNGLTPNSILEPTFELSDQVLIHTFPNPFNSIVNIRYECSLSNPARLSIYSCRGSQVAQYAFIPGDEVNLHWKGKDQKGASLPNGIYLVQLQNDKQISTTKILLLK